MHTRTHTQVREAYLKWWYNKKRKYQFFSKIYLIKTTSLQTPVSYNDVIINISYFLTE